MKIVLDTNVLVSGLLTPFGASAQIVRMVASGQLVVIGVDGRPQVDRHSTALCDGC